MKNKLLIFLCLNFLFLEFSTAANFDILFTVNVPDNTPSGDDIYMFYKIEGGADQTVKLTRTGSKDWETILSLEDDVEVEYKFHRGEWSTCETDINNELIDNRTMTPYSSDQIIGSTIMQWIDLPAARRIAPVLSYYNESPQTSIAITWVTTSGVSHVVKYGVNDISENTFTVTENVAISGDDGVTHTARLSGLLPNTTYKYQVVSQGAYESAILHFTTADNGNNFMFAVVGDSQLALVKSMTDSIDVQKPCFVLHAGDIAVNGNEIDEWYEAFNGFGDFLGNNVTMPVYGNHDEPGVMLTNLWKFPENGSTTPRLQGHWYSLDYNNVHIIGLSVFDPFIAGTEQYDWLVDDLEHVDSDIDHIIVYLHKPIYCSSGYHPAESNIIDAFEPLFIEHGVEIVFNGHNHWYERSIANGITYITTGGLSRWLKTPIVGTNDNGVWVEKINNYCKVYVNEGDLRVEMIKPDGSIGDAFGSDTSSPIVADGSQNDWWKYNVPALANDTDDAQTTESYKMDSLKVVSDDDYFYFSFYTGTQDVGVHYAMYIDTDNSVGSGATTDCWAAEVSAISAHRPELATYFFLNEDLNISSSSKQFFVWRDTWWEKRLIGHEVSYDSSNKFIEIKIPKDAPGLNGHDKFHVSLFNFGVNKYVSETLPSDPAVDFTTENTSSAVQLSEFAYYNGEVLVVNHAPTALNLSPVNITENGPRGTLIGTLTATDADVADVFEYVLNSGDGLNDVDNADFYITDNELFCNVITDYEVKNKYKVHITVTDNSGASFDSAFEIIVDDVVEVSISEDNEDIVFLVTVEDQVASYELNQLNGTISVYNSQGILVNKLTKVSKNGIIPFDQSAAGMYIVKYSYNNKELSQKIMLK